MNPMLGQVLGGLFGHAMRQRGMRGGAGGLGGMRGGPLGGGMGGLGGGLGGAAMGSVLGGILAGGRGRVGGRGLGGNQTAIMLMLLPLAMKWVQRNGGIGAVLDRFRQKGYGGQMQSWVGTGDNQPLDEQAVEQVVGHQDLQQMAQELGVPEQEVRHAFAEVMPEMVNQLTPEGQLPQEADDVLDESRHVLEKEIEDVRYREIAPS